MLLPSHIRWQRDPRIASSAHHLFQALGLLELTDESVALLLVPIKIFKDEGRVADEMPRECYNDRVIQSQHIKVIAKCRKIDGFFQNDKAYQLGLLALDTTESMLANYVRESRKWLEPLKLFRNEIEHETYVPPRIVYDRTTDDHIVAREPRFLGSPLTVAVPYIENRMNRFVEEILVWC